MVGESGSAELWGRSRRGLGAARGSGAGCRAADRLLNTEYCFVGSASMRAAAPGLHRKPCKPGHVHRARIEVGTLRGRRRLCHRGHAAAFVPGACGAAAWQASDSRRGRELGCAQGTTCVGYPARRRAEGGRDGGCRLCVAAVAYCEADDRVVNSASPHAAAPRSLDETLECHRRPTSKRRRPMAVSTGARRRRNGASVSRTLTEYSRATRMRWGWAPSDWRVPTQSAACACGVGSSGRVDATGGVSGAGPAAAGAAADGNPLGWLTYGRSAGGRGFGSIDAHRLKGVTTPKGRGWF